MTAAAVAAFLLVALAELGDKSQLLLVAFAARYRPLSVLAGAAIAVAALQLLAVAAGGLAGSLLPTALVAVVAGIAFIVFGVLTWRGPSGGVAEDGRGAVWRSGPVLTVAAAFFLAEFGDKTQLMTVSIAADPAAAFRTLGAIAAGFPAPEAGASGTLIGVWSGSTLGMLAADAVAIALGAAAGHRLPERVIRRVAAVVFIVFGVITLVSAFVIR